ncbi:MAG: hypothetical protein ACFB0E_11520 [Leptolyngbyaceae cyanobacterium]
MFLVPGLVLVLQDFEEKLRRINKQLRQEKVGVAIEAKCQRLTLRANLSPKPDSDRTGAKLIRPHKL